MICNGWRRCCRGRPTSRGLRCPARSVPARECSTSIRLQKHLAARMPPDELIDGGTGVVVVSSIHRAKGLEFDTVLLIPFDIAEEDWLQEARVLYVGLTRAKHNLMTLKRVDDGRWSFIEERRTLAARRLRG